MRIISGKKKGIIIHAPKNLPVRPTTDMAKESLFNILENNFDLNSISALDLFSGTGNVSYEFCSRGSLAVTAVDIDFGCVKFIKESKIKFDFNALEIHKKDVFVFLKQCTNVFDIIFADAPYKLEKIITLPQLILDNKILKQGGWLIVEHENNLDLSHEIGFFEKRKYGQSAFSFFKYL